MAEMTKHAARLWMRKHADEHRDRKTGEINSTTLAEACADAFGAAHTGGPLDNPDHWIWELAIEDF